MDTRDPNEPIKTRMKTEGPSEPAKTGGAKPESSPNESPKQAHSEDGVEPAS